MNNRFRRLSRFGFPALIIGFNLGIVVQAESFERKCPPTAARIVNACPSPEQNRSRPLSPETMKGSRKKMERGMLERRHRATAGAGKAIQSKTD